MPKWVAHSRNPKAANDQQNERLCACPARRQCPQSSDSPERERFEPETSHPRQCGNMLGSPYRQISWIVGLEPKYTHKTVNHSLGEYRRHEGKSVVGTFTVEGYFANLKRGIMGVFGHVSAQHLPLYLAEFEHRYNCRKITDGERTDIGLTKAVGKRLILKTRD